MIEVENLTRVFSRKQPRENSNFISRFFLRDTVKINALSNINFKINKGERVAYIGLNGAGKSTTIKLLCGVIVPSNGTVLIDNQDPRKSRKTLSYKTTVIFGQKSQLWWDLPAIRSFEFLSKIYNINKKDYNQRIEYFSYLLELDKLLHAPIRTLSLGQRVRVEFAAAFLNRPSLAYLDEPTIGLDIFAREKIISFLHKINKDEKTTLFIASHDLNDLEQTCDRVLVIDNGKILFDGSTSNIKKTYINYREIKVHGKTRKDIKSLSKYFKIIPENDIIIFRFIPVELSVAKAIELILSCYDPDDISIAQPSLQDVVKSLRG